MTHTIGAIFDDELLKNMVAAERRAHLFDRQKVMRSYVASLGYLDQDEKTGNSYIKGLLRGYPVTDEGFKRKLTAILSADAVGYSRLMAEGNI